MMFRKFLLAIALLCAAPAYAASCQTFAAGDLTYITKLNLLAAGCTPTVTSDYGLPRAAGGGSVDAITATYSPAVALTDKTMVALIAAGANTSTTPTFAPNGLTARTIVARGGAALVAGDIGASGFVALLEYNLANTRWELLNPVMQPVAFGGTGRATSTTAYGLIAAGTTATGAHQTLAAGATTEILVGGGASALPAWTTATGTGAPMRAGSPTTTGALTAGTAAFVGAGAVVATSSTTTTGTNYGVVSQITGAGATANIGLYASASGATSNYGVWINAPTASANNYALYSAASARSYFAGNVAIGSTNAPNTSLSIGGGATRSSTQPTNAIDVFDGTAPIGTLANGVTFYSTSGIPTTMNAAGTATRLSGGIYARAYHSTTQSINNAALTVLALDSERYDTDTIHDTVTNNSRLTAKTAGWYDISALVEFDANTTGIRNLNIIVNGGSIICSTLVNASSAFGSRMNCSTQWLLAVNDYVEIQIYQTSGGALNVTSSAAYSPELMMTRMF